VPYRGTPQVLQDLIAEQIDLVFDQAPPRQGWHRLPIFQQSTKLDCPDSMPRSGLDCGECLSAAVDYRNGRLRRARRERPRGCSAAERG
jgi:hypothetical protein